MDRFAAYSGGTGSAALATVLLVATASLATVLQANAKISFEKMTNRDYSGVAFYSIQNVSLFECLGWCKEDSSCTSAAFSFVVNPFAALQETTCTLHNETQARQAPYLRQSSLGEQVAVVAQPQKAANLYFFNKLDIAADNVCARLWAFERFPNRKLRHHDRQSQRGVYTKEACLAACLSADASFVCRSAEYNYLTQQCFLNGYDRRSPIVVASAASSLSGLDLLDAPGTDYFENACLLGEDVCTESRIYDYAKTGAPLQRVAHFVELNYYPDKEMLVKSQAGCIRACTIEHEFICRSILYRSTYKQGQPNCALYHLDHKTFPDGADTFASAHFMQPLLASAETSAVYLEAVCNETLPSTAASLFSSPFASSTMAATSLGSSPASLVASLSSSSSSSSPSQPFMASTMPSTLPLGITIVPSQTTPNAVQIHPSANNLHITTTTSSTASANSAPKNHSTATLNFVTGERYVASTTLSPLQHQHQHQHQHHQHHQQQLQQAAASMRLPSNIHVEMPPNGRLPSHFTIGPARNPSPATVPSSILIGPAPANNNDNLMDESSPPTSTHSFGGFTSSPLTSGANYDQNCDSHGFCYNVSLRCTDTKMVVKVKTERPFHGRVYALGRSETCNENINNQNQFALEMLLSGKDCNTQSASGIYTNTIVLQHHNVVLTKADKVYHVRCTYETASRNVSFGMMPVKDMFEVDMLDRNQETIHISASPDAPLPKISILTLDGKEANTVRIGDRLTFRIEIPENTPYGIFARSCVAMAKDARSTFDIIDANGCPVDHTIFPSFLPVGSGSALESSYEAFRFTESYGVIFQCNVKYCIGKCDPAVCSIGRGESVEAWGRKKRSIDADDDDSRTLSGKRSGSKASRQSGGGNWKDLGDDMTLSREIVVLDLNEQIDNSPAMQSGALGAAKAPLKASADHDTANLLPENRHCLSSASVFVLICSVSLFFVLYVCVIAYFYARKDAKVSAIKHQYH